MVHLYFINNSGNLISFNKRMVENTRQGMVPSPSGLHNNSFIVLYPNITPWINKIEVSIVICTYGRPESLNETLLSLTKQTFRDFEVLLITEKGNLASLRDKGLKSAIGSIVAFIDDDVYCPPTWLEGVVKSFREGVVGVTGPTVISEEYQKNRDCFRYKRIRAFQEWLFRVPSDPSKLSVCGAPSMGSNFPGCRFEGEVDYLECCNMSVKREDAIAVGGFDHNYKRTGEWCELDLAMRLRKRGRLVFTQQSLLHHKPSKAGIYSNRLSTEHRWKNFIYFQKKWVKPSLLTYIYRGFIWTYFQLKQMRTI